MKTPYSFIAACLLVLLLAGIAGERAHSQTYNQTHDRIHGVMTTIRLQQLCDSPYDVDAGMCAGYVMAIAEMILQDPRPSRRVCLSPAVGPETLIQNLRRAWQNNPPAAYELAIENVETTLRDRFKCP